MRAAARYTSDAPMVFTVYVEPSEIQRSPELLTCICASTALPAGTVTTLGFSVTHVRLGTVVPGVASTDTELTYSVGIGVGVGVGIGVMVGVGMGVAVGVGGVSRMRSISLSPATQGWGVTVQDSDCPPLVVVVAVASSKSSARPTVPSSPMKSA